LTCEELLQLQELCGSLCIDLVPMIDIGPLDLHLSAPLDPTVAAAAAVASERERERENARREELTAQVSITDREQYDLLSVFPDDSSVAFVISADDGTSAFTGTDTEASADSSTAVAAVGRKLWSVAPQMGAAQIWGLGGCYTAKTGPDVPLTKSESGHGCALEEVVGALNTHELNHCVSVAVETTNAHASSGGGSSGSSGVGLLSARAAAHMEAGGVGMAGCAGGIGSCSTAAWPATAAATNALVEDLTAAVQVAVAYGGGGEYIVGEQTSIR
jgi:hypothetical protein